MYNVKTMAMIGPYKQELGLAEASASTATSATQYRVVGRVSRRIVFTARPKPLVRKSGSQQKT